MSNPFIDANPSFAPVTVYCVSGASWNDAEAVRDMNLREAFDHVLHSRPLLYVSRCTANRAIVECMDGMSEEYDEALPLSWTIEFEDGVWTWNAKDADGDNVGSVVLYKVMIS